MCTKSELFLLCVEKYSSEKENSCEFGNIQNEIVDLPNIMSVVMTFVNPLVIKVAVTAKRAFLWTNVSIEQG
jgi:hypothetical protein